MSVLNWLTGRFSNGSRALSLCKRGMARARKHDPVGAIGDYTASLDTPELPANVKAMALYNRALAYSASGDDPKAVDDLQNLLAMDEATINVRTEAKRKLLRIQRRDDDTKTGAGRRHNE